MLGTTLIITNKYFEKENLITKDYMENNNSLIYSNFNKKFFEDKVFNEDDEVLIVIDGVILNNKELKIKYSAKDNFDLIKKMYKKNGMKFVDMLSGNFYGLLYDYSSKEWHIFTNHLGNKPIYKYFNVEEKTLIISSDLYDLIKVIKELKLTFSIDELGAYYMLTFGYMLLDTTLISEIKKVNPGTILSYKDGILKEEQYYFIDNENYLSDPENKVIDNMYELFRNSINQSFAKDEEYGYKHISYLSGGLDSRMISIVAKELGYKDITTLTFSENYSRDEKIARKIAADLGFENIFKSLNNGNFLMNIEKAVDANFGQIIYSGSAHLLDATNSINLEPYGLLHNGNLADVMHGDYIEGVKHTSPSLSNWAYSKRLLNKVSFMENTIKEKYNNEERFAIYNRGINAIYNGSISMLDKVETCEPFTHKDVIEYCTRMHPKDKYKEALFLKMIQKYYPEAINYKWQKWNLKPNKLNTMFMGTFAGKVFRVLDAQIQLHFSQSNNMNPFNRWYSNNTELRKFIDSYLKENIHVLSPYLNIKKDCEEIYNSGTVTEKTQVMTLVQFIKRIEEI